MTFRVTTEVRRPTATVFAFLADATQMPRWYEAVVAVDQLIPGPISVGTRYRVVRRLPGGRKENLVEVSEYHPDRRIAITSLEGPTPFAYRYTLDSDGDDTLLRLDGEISGEGLAGPTALLAPLASRFFERGMRGNLDRLAALLEEPRGESGRGGATPCVAE